MIIQDKHKSILIQEIKDALEGIYAEDSIDSALDIDTIKPGKQFFIN